MAQSMTPRVELDASRRIIPVKIIVAGGFGVGKTTLVSAVSEIAPLTTEAAMTAASIGVDDASFVSNKTSTTVAMDFGRITVSDTIVLYLFGTPGQHRFGFMWDELSRGALGALVLIDSRRIADSFAALDYFEARDIPYVAALNCFDGVLWHNIDDVRDALGVGGHVPLMVGDVRQKDHVKDLLIRVLELTRERALARRAD